MELKTKRCYLLSLTLIVFSGGCDPDTPKTLHQLNDSIRKWLAPYDVDGKTFAYKNELNETAAITVKGRLFQDANRLFPCFRDNVPGQCEYEATTLEFTADSDTIMHLSILLFGEDRITLNYDRQVGSVTPAITWYTETSQELIDAQPNNFSVTFNTNYSFEGEMKNAFVINTTTLANLGINSIPPKGFVLIEGEGIVEWTDYGGKVWKLVD